MGNYTVSPEFCSEDWSQGQSAVEKSFILGHHHISGYSIHLMLGKTPNVLVNFGSNSHYWPAQRSLSVHESAVVMTWLTRLGLCKDTDIIPLQLVPSNWQSSGHKIRSRLPLVTPCPVKVNTSGNFSLHSFERSSKREQNIVSACSLQYYPLRPAKTVIFLEHTFCWN